MISRKFYEDEKGPELDQKVAAGPELPRKPVGAHCSLGIEGDGMKLQVRHLLFKPEELLFPYIVGSDGQLSNRELAHT